MNSSTSNSNRNKRRRSLTGVLLILVALLLFDRGLFYLITHLEAGFYAKKGFEVNFKTFAKEQNYDTLLFGTSRTYEGIHSSIIEKELNNKVLKESFQGKGPRYNYHFYQLFKKCVGKPKVVIYGVDYFIYTLNSDPRWMSRFDFYNLEQLKIDYLTPSLLLLKHKKKIDNFYNNIMLRLKEELESGEVDEEKEKKNPLDKELKHILDVQAHTGIEKHNQKVVAKRFPRFRRQRYPHYPGKEGEYFAKLLELLDKDGVTVILVSLPDVFGSYKTNFQRKTFLLELKRKEAKYEKTHLINFNRPTRFPLRNLDYFIDGGFGISNSHLSRKGSKLFSEQLSKKITKYYK
ncbi:MAG: hypothetical protein GY757_36550 [bacterium]|nr:hypothetical protein [bacterium]